MCYTCNCHNSFQKRETSKGPSGGIHSWGTTFGCLMEKGFFKNNFTCLVGLDLYCEAYFGSYLHFILHIEYTDKVNLEGIPSSKIILIP
jgi:hypothetical protein